MKPKRERPHPGQSTRKISLGSERASIYGGTSNTATRLIGSVATIEPIERLGTIEGLITGHSDFVPLRWWLTATEPPQNVAGFTRRT